MNAEETKDLLAIEEWFQIGKDEGPSSKEFDGGVSKPLATYEPAPIPASCARQLDSEFHNSAASLAAARAGRRTQGTVASWPPPALPSPSGRFS